MHPVDDYLQAATRDNTRRSYRAAVEHFEVTWGGVLPTTADTLARYLATYAPVHTVSTLRQRLAALSRWHQDQGFPDPTKAPLVKQVMRGIAVRHPAPPEQATPLPLAVLAEVDGWLVDHLAQARGRHDRPASLRYARDRALLWIGFWRGSRSDELVRLRIEQITVVPGQGLSLYLPFSKKEREGATLSVPALSRFCPVAAYQEWLEKSGLTEGPVFRGIDRWGHIRAEGLNVQSVSQVLRDLLGRSGTLNAGDYTGHSLRRGFATWATASGWDLKSLMAHVGWKDMKSALRYIDPSAGAQDFIESRLVVTHHPKNITQSNLLSETKQS